MTAHSTFATAFAHRLKTAPVTVALEIDLPQPPREVWPHLVKVERWQRWYRGIDSAVLRMSHGGAIAPGDRLDWRVDGLRVRSVLVDVSPPTHLAWTLRTLGAQGALCWTLTPAGEEGCVVRLEEWWDGLPVRLLRRTLRRTLQISRTAWLEGLERLVSGP